MKFYFVEPGLRYLIIQNFDYVSELVILLNLQKKVRVAIFLFTAHLQLQCYWAFLDSFDDLDLDLFFAWI